MRVVNMKKIIFTAVCFGAPTGLAIKLCHHDYYFPCLSTTAFRRVAGALPPFAVRKLCRPASVSIILSGAIYGQAPPWFGEKENWSPLRQTITHLIIGSTATFPIAYLLLM